MATSMEKPNMRFMVLLFFNDCKVPEKVAYPVKNRMSGN
jgi:hypothetical protein